MKEIIRDTLLECAALGNTIDDQTLFWRQLHSKRNSSWHHCNAKEVDDAKNRTTDLSDHVSLCCFDPHHYATGFGQEGHAAGIIAPQDLISFHANFGSNTNNKIAKLRLAREDGYGWDDARIVHRP